MSLSRAVSVQMAAAASGAGEKAAAAAPPAGHPPQQPQPTQTGGGGGGKSKKRLRSESSGGDAVAGAAPMAQNWALKSTFKAVGPAPADGQCRFRIVQKKQWCTQPALIDPKFGGMCTHHRGLNAGAAAAAAAAGGGAGAALADTGTVERVLCTLCGSHIPKAKYQRHFDKACPKRKEMAHVTRWPWYSARCNYSLLTDTPRARDGILAGLAADTTGYGGPNELKVSLSRMSATELLDQIRRVQRACANVVTHYDWDTGAVLTDMERTRLCLDPTALRAKYARVFGAASDADVPVLQSDDTKHLAAQQNGDADASAAAAAGSAFVSQGDRHLVQQSSIVAHLQRRHLLPASAAASSASAAAAAAARVSAARPSPSASSSGGGGLCVVELGAGKGGLSSVIGHVLHHVEATTTTRSSSVSAPPTVSSGPPTGTATAAPASTGSTVAAATSSTTGGLAERAGARHSRIDVAHEQAERARNARHSLVLVDNQAFRHTSDRDLTALTTDSKTLAQSRYRIDLRDFALQHLGEAQHHVTGRTTLCVGKHLCGGATDLSLRAAVNAALHHQQQQQQQQPPSAAAAAAAAVAAPSASSASSSSSGGSGGVRVSGVCIATCCHARCDWWSYVDADFLLRVGLVDRGDLIGPVTPDPPLPPPGSAAAAAAAAAAASPPVPQVSGGVLRLARAFKRVCRLTSWHTSCGDGTAYVASSSAAAAAANKALPLLPVLPPLVDDERGFAPLISAVAAEGAAVMAGAAAAAAGGGRAGAGAGGVSAAATTVTTAASASSAASNSNSSGNKRQRTAAAAASAAAASGGGDEHDTAASDDDDDDSNTTGRGGGGTSSSASRLLSGAAKERIGLALKHVLDAGRALWLRRHLLRLSSAAPNGIADGGDFTPAAAPAPAASTAAAGGGGSGAGAVELVPYCTRATSRENVLLLARF